MRLSPLHCLLALGLAQAPAFAQETDLSGVWVGWQCPAGVKADMRQCAHFMLELHQRDGLLCGAHLFATANAGEMDEGRVPSVRGTLTSSAAAQTDAEADIVTTSGRAPVEVHARLRRDGAALLWERLDDPAGDYLLPMQLRLTRSRSKTLLAPVYAQALHAACQHQFVVARQTNPLPTIPIPADAAATRR